MLEVKKLSVTYNGNIKALKGVHLHVNKGEIVVLIGANGAGKTTLLKALTGLVKIDSGSFANLDLTGLDVSQCTDMSYMFDSCWVRNIDCSGWDVRNVINMEFTFSQCRSTINASDWDTSY